jgi:ATP-dependent exoDNAse (exonuclease V) beta subunit
VSGEWLQARKTQAEMVRLLYVATTRAKQRLVISGGWPAPGKVVPPEAAANFAALVGRRLDAETVAAQVEAASVREIDGESLVQRVLPAFAEPPDDTADEDETTEAWLPTDQQMLAIDELAAARRSAADRMEQSIVRSASAEAHDRLRRADGEEEDPGTVAYGSRDLAMAIGTAVHGLLETVDIGSDLAKQVEESRDRLMTEIARGLDENQVPDAEKAINELLAGIAAGPCLERLSVLAPAIVARELPVFGWEEPGDGPSAVVSGIVDLVYRDPDDGHLVVADYKTDAVDDEDTVGERARIYEPQVAAYARILRDALCLDEEPHTELWFLAAGRIVRL